MFDNHQRKVLDGRLGHVHIDASLECGYGTNRDGHVSAAPQVPFQKEDMGNVMGPTFDDEALDHSDVAIRGMNAIASVNPHLTQGERVMGDGLRRILSSGHGYQSPPVVRQGERLLGPVGGVADAAGHELNLPGHSEVLEGGQVTSQRDVVPRCTDEIERNEPTQPLPVLCFDNNVGDFLSHGIDNDAPHLTARAITTADLGIDPDDLVIAGRAPCFSVLSLAIPGFMSVLVGRSLVSDLHSVSSVQSFARGRIWAEISVIETAAIHALLVLGLPAPLTMIDDVSAVLSGVRHDKTKPQGEYEDCDDPQRREGESEQAKQQGQREDGCHCGAGNPSL
ncbi:MAG: hypothetical protein ACLPVF_10910 [Acidimicrobiales bacterium]